MKNRFEICDDIVKIYIENNGKTYTCLIDLDDLDKVMEIDHSWYLHRSTSKTPYAIANRGRKTVLMHRQIMNPSQGLEVDHINHNNLDNRKRNLRVVTTKENLKNRRDDRKEINHFTRYDKKSGKWTLRIRRKDGIFELSNKLFNSREEAIEEAIKILSA